GRDLLAWGVGADGGQVWAWFHAQLGAEFAGGGVDDAQRLDLAAGGGGQEGELGGDRFVEGVGGGDSGQAGQGLGDAAGGTGEVGGLDGDGAAGLLDFPCAAAFAEPARQVLQEGALPEVEG